MQTIRWAEAYLDALSDELEAWGDHFESKVLPGLNMLHQYRQRASEGDLGTNMQAAELLEQLKVWRRCIGRTLVAQWARLSVRSSCAMTVCSRAMRRDLVRALFHQGSSVPGRWAHTASLLGYLAHHWSRSCMFLNQLAMLVSEVGHLLRQELLGSWYADAGQQPVTAWALLWGYVADVYAEDGQGSDGLGMSWDALGHALSVHLRAEASTDEHGLDLGAVVSDLCGCAVRLVRLLANSATCGDDDAPVVPNQSNSLKSANAHGTRTLDEKPVPSEDGEGSDNDTLPVSTDSQEATSRQPPAQNEPNASETKASPSTVHLPKLLGHPFTLSPRWAGWNRVTSPLCMVLGRCARAVWSACWSVWRPVTQESAGSSTHTRTHHARALTDAVGAWQRLGHRCLTADDTQTVFRSAWEVAHLTGACLSHHHVRLPNTVAAMQEESVHGQSMQEESVHGQSMQEESVHGQSMQEESVHGQSSGCSEAMEGGLQEESVHGQSSGCSEAIKGGLQEESVHGQSSGCSEAMEGGRCRGADASVCSAGWLAMTGAVLGWCWRFANRLDTLLIQVPSDTDAQSRESSDVRCGGHASHGSIVCAPQKGAGCAAALAKAFDHCKHVGMYAENVVRVAYGLPVKGSGRQSAPVLRASQRYANARLLVETLFQCLAEVLERENGGGRGKFRAAHAQGDSGDEKTGGENSDDSSDSKAQGSRVISGALRFPDLLASSACWHVYSYAAALLSQPLVRAPADTGESHEKLQRQATPSVSERDLTAMLLCGLTQLGRTMPMPCLHCPQAPVSLRRMSAATVRCRCQTKPACTACSLRFWQAAEAPPSADTPQGRKPVGPGARGAHSQQDSCVCAVPAALAADWTRLTSGWYRCEPSDGVRQIAHDPSGERAEMLFLHGGESRSALSVARARWLRFLQAPMPAVVVERLVASILGGAAEQEGKRGSHQGGWQSSGVGGVSSGDSSTSTGHADNSSTEGVLPFLQVNMVDVFCVWWLRSADQDADTRQREPRSQGSLPSDQAELQGASAGHPKFGWREIEPRAVGGLDLQLHTCPPQLCPPYCAQGAERLAPTVLCALRSGLSVLHTMSVAQSCWPVVARREQQKGVYHKSSLDSRESLPVGSSGGAASQNSALPQQPQPRALGSGWNRKVPSPGLLLVAPHAKVALLAVVAQVTRRLRVEPAGSTEGGHESKGATALQRWAHVDDVDGFGDMEATEIILSQSVLDRHQPLSKEWALLGSSFLLQHSARNRQRLEQWRMRRVEDPSALKEFGVSVEAGGGGAGDIRLVRDKPTRTSEPRQ